jgi:hypothetical protein
MSRLWSTNLGLYSNHFRTFAYSAFFSEYAEYKACFVRYSVSRYKPRFVLHTLKLLKITQFLGLANFDRKSLEA